MKRVLKRFASHLPLSTQVGLKKLYFRHMIARGSFDTDEPEYALLSRWVKPGDLVVDGGANVGHYTRELSRLVGPKGRVLAFEPMPPTFEVLTSNCSGCDNVTLLNAALSSGCKLVFMETPQFDDGSANYYQSHVGNTGVSVLALALDSYRLDSRVSLVKLDLEGHETEALRGMRSMLARDKPRLIVEGNPPEVVELLSELGYAWEALPGSPNRIWTN